MRKLIFCCLVMLLITACSERRIIVQNNDIMGYWAMEFEGTNQTFITMPDDSVCTAGLIFNRDTVYMQVRSDGRLVKNEFVGKYYVKDNQLTLISRDGIKKQCEFDIRNEEMFVLNKDESENPVIRLRKIKENSRVKS